MTTGWAFLVARGRRQGHRARLVPDVLAGQGLAGVVEQNRSVDTPIGRVTVVSRTHRIRSEDIGSGHVLDEHGRPLDIIYGFVCIGASLGDIDEVDLTAALAQALAVYRRYLADESSFTTEVSRPFPLQSVTQRIAALTNESKGFWQTVPGILTGLAGILTAIGAILAILFQLGVIGGPGPSPTDPRSTATATLSRTSSVVGGWDNATAIMTANDGTVNRSRASTFRYCFSGGAGVFFNNAQDIAFESMTLIEVLHSDVALSPGGRADVRITLTTGTVLTGTIDAGCDFIMQAEAGRVSLYPDKVRKIEFQRPLDLIGLGLVGLRTRPARALLSALGISIGIATMIVVTAIPSSSQAALREKLAALGTNALQATQANADSPDAVPLPESAVSMVQRIGPVTTVSAVANTHTRVRRNDRLDPADGGALTVLASRLDLLPTINAQVRSGRWLNAATANFPTVVLGAVAAVRLGITDLPAGQPAQQVIIADTAFTVIGILHTTPLSPDIDRSVLVGWEAARAALGFDGHPTVLYVRCVESQVEAVRSVLAKTISPERPGQVVVTRPSEALAAKRATENSFSVLFLALAAVALVVGGIGVANTMVVAVLERRAEIGLRRALGATRGQIRGQFLTESVVMALLGGLAGTAFGLLATIGYAAWQQWPLVVSVGSAVTGVGGAVVVGVLAGVYPSVRAARLTPTQALATV